MNLDEIMNRTLVRSATTGMNDWILYLLWYKVVIYTPDLIYTQQLVASCNLFILEFRKYQCLLIVVYLLLTWIVLNKATAYSQWTSLAARNSTVILGLPAGSGFYY